MPIIDLPDGNQLDIPDDAPPEMLAAVRTKLQGMGNFGTAQKAPEPAGFLESTVRDLASGFGTAASLAPRAASFLLKAAPGTEGLREGLDSAADSAESYWKSVGDKSTNNPWGQKAARGIGGALSTGPASLPAAAAGAGAGVGDEAAERMSNGNPNPLLRAGANIVGGVLGGTAASLPYSTRSQTKAVAREAMEGISPEQLNTAQQYKNELAQKGIEVDLAQALQATTGHSGNLGSVRDFLAGRVQGDKVQAGLRAQPEQLAREANLTMNSLPGTNYEWHQNANNVQQAASGRLQQEVAARKTAVDQLYEKAGALPEGTADELITLIRRDLAKPGMTTLAKERGEAMIKQITGENTDAAKQVAAARSQLDSATTITGRQQARAKLAEANATLDAQTTKALEAKDVSTWIGELRGPYQGGVSLKQTHPKEQGQLKGLAGQLNAALADVSPEISQANQVFKNFTESRINPLKQGPVGMLNQAHGADPATAAMVSKFDGLMNAGSDVNAKVSSIKTAAAELAKSDPEAFQDAFKGWVSRKVAGATTASGGGSALPTTDPKKLAEALFDKPLQWQGIKDATEIFARTQGVRPEEMIRGLENLRQMTTAMKSFEGKIGGISPNDLKQMGSASNTANLVRVASFLPANRLGEGIERATFGKTLSQLDTILTSPEGAKMLIALGKVPVMSKKAQVILGTWGATNGNSDGLTDSNPPY